MPTVFLYARCSHVDQMVTGESIEHQVIRLREYNDRRIRCSKVEIVKDEAVSAYKFDFIYRDGGKFVMNTIRRGDHLVIDKLDRLCRNALDFLTVINQMNHKGVNVHIVNLAGMEMDVTSGFGKMFLTIMAAVAEMESHNTSERTKAALAMRRAQGKATSGKLPYGMRNRSTSTSDGGVAKFVEWCPQSRGLMKDIVRLKDDHNHTFAEIAMLLNRDHMRKNGRTERDYHPLGHNPRLTKGQKRNPKLIKRLANARPLSELPWSVGLVHSRYEREKFYMACEARGVVTAKDTVIALHAMNKEKDALREQFDVSKHIDFDAKLAPVPGVPKNKMPAWAERQLEASGKEIRGNFVDDEQFNLYQAVRAKMAETND